MKLKRILLAAAIIFAFSACNVRPQSFTEATISETAAETTAPPATTTAAPVTTTAEIEIPTVPVSEGGSVFNIYGVSDEFKGFFDEYYLKDNVLPAGVTVNHIITSDQNQHMRKIEADVLANAFADSSKKIDLFIAEYQYSNKFADPKYAVPLSQLGITESELSDQFPYTKTLTSTASGVQMGVGYQNTAEMVIYRKSIAKDVLGTDNPEEVAGYLDTFAEFDETAKKMKMSGYTMLGSHQEMFRMYIQTADSGITVNGTNITVPKIYEDWANNAKSYVENGYAQLCGQWSRDWENGMKRDSRVFAYIGPQWQSELNVAIFTDTKLDWDFCPGPTASYWGGAAIFAASGTDNADLAADVISYFASDKSGLKRIAKENVFLPSSISVSNELGDNTILSGIGQTGYFPVKRFAEAANKIEIKSVSKYNFLNETYMIAIDEYIAGITSYEEAYDNFKKRAFNIINGVEEQPIPDGEVTMLEITLPDGLNVLYSGTIKDGQPNGQGTLFYENYWPDQKPGAYVTEEGTFENGRLVGDYVRTMPHFDHFTRVEYNNTFNDASGSYIRRAEQIFDNGDIIYQDDIFENGEIVDTIYYDSKPQEE
jgi:hypothetical protein